MNQREATRRVLEATRSISGHAVLVHEDSTLKTLARVQMARGDAQAHVITYKPAAAPQPDYLIAYQCGFIIRLFSLPPEERRDFASTVRSRQIVERLLNDGPARNLPPAVRTGLRDQLFDGLMLQLRSIPVGMRVDTWILREYPQLADLQRDAALRQLQENQQALSPDVRKIAPTKVYRGSVTMNAAFAAFWARTFDDPSLTLPYKAAGFEKPGAELVATFDGVPDTPDEDRALIDAWATALSLSNWYEWIPFGPGVAAAP